MNQLFKAGEKSNRNPPNPPNLPRNPPNHDRNSNTRRTSHSPNPKTRPPATLPVISGRSQLQRSLVRARIDHAPDCGTDSGDHGYNPPVCAEVLDAPDDGDDDRDEREGGAVAETDEGCCYVCERGMVQGERRGEEEVA